MAGTENGRSDLHTWITSPPDTHGNDTIITPCIHGLPLPKACHQQNCWDTRQMPARAPGLPHHYPMAQWLGTLGFHSLTPPQVHQPVSQPSSHHMLDGSGFSLGCALTRPWSPPPMSLLARALASPLHLSLPLFLTHPDQAQASLLLVSQWPGTVSPPQVPCFPSPFTDAL